MSRNKKSTRQLITPEETEQGLNLFYGTPLMAYEPSQTVVVEDERGQYREVNTPAWFKISSAFKDKLLSLKGCRLSVFIALATHLDYTNRCHPTVETLCKLTGYKKAAVLKAIQSLERERLITVIRKHRQANLYYVRYFVALGAKNNPRLP